MFDWLIDFTAQLASAWEWLTTPLVDLPSDFDIITTPISIVGFGVFTLLLVLKLIKHIPLA